MSPARGEVRPREPLSSVAQTHATWADIRRLAERQWGHVVRSQLAALGIAPSTVDTWVTRGRLISIHNGVYAVGYRRIEPEARAAAAVLAGRPDAVLSHDSAAALWGLRRWPDRPEITCRRRVEHRGIQAHRSRTLTDDDVTTQLGIPTTTAARTLRDIRGRVKPRRFEQLVNRARLEHHLDSDQAAALLRHRHNPTRSGGEDTLLHFCRRRRLPEPQLNTRVCGFEVDALFEAERVIVEIDHFATHGDEASFEEDRLRDAELHAAGYLVVRITEQRLRRSPDTEARRLRRILKRRRADLEADIPPG